MASVTIPRPDDWHLHLRDGSMLDAVVRFSAGQYRYGMVMPNLRPPIISVDQALAYRGRILDAAKQDASSDSGVSAFTPLMTLALTPGLDVPATARAVADGLVGGVKYYPVGATTNSDFSNSSLSGCLDALEGLARHGVRLLVHAESVNPAVDIFDREAAFFDEELIDICDRLPELAVTVEHVSTKRGVEFVRSYPQVAATITPHHLLVERSALLADGMRPDLFCKPVINSRTDRSALVEAATAGPSEFCFGSDSAPHPTTAKYGRVAAAGIFNAAHGLAVTAEVFHRHGALDRLADFVSHNGCGVYGVETSTDRVTLWRDDADPSGQPDELIRTAEGAEVVSFGSDVGASWAFASGGVGDPE